MHNRNHADESFNTDTTSQSETGKGKGAQGIDKAPGEETAQDLENVAQETQKGKKVDADPAQGSDRPIDQPNG